MSIQAPFGGKKASGIGREFGEYVSITLETLFRFVKSLS
jgi:acyl-CoA reductase-like NAD-dependent aldehyde dehydrogenase